MISSIGQLGALDRVGCDLDKDFQVLFDAWVGLGRKSTSQLCVDKASGLELPLDKTGRQVADLVVVAFDSKLRGRFRLQLGEQFDHEPGILVAFFDPVGNRRRGGFVRRLSPDPTDGDQRDQTDDEMSGRAAWHLHQVFSFIYRRKGLLVCNITISVQVCSPPALIRGELSGFRSHASRISKRKGHRNQPMNHA